MKSYPEYPERSFSSRLSKPSSRGTRSALRLRRLSLSALTCGSLLAGLLSSACSREVRRFPLAPTVWTDPDQHPLPKAPSKYYSGINGDGVDKLAFYPIANTLSMPRYGEATNVNALDEVPNSSWFQNRIGWFQYTPEQVASAECGQLPNLSEEMGAWTVVGAKPDGANPGFFVKGPDGFRYLLKFDGKNQPLRATAADVIGSKLYWAIGYHSVCNEIVYFHRDHLVMDPSAVTKTDLGEERPMTAEDVDRVLAMAFRLKDGRLRASASRFVPGKPLGPFKYESTRGDDPNDVIPHEDRRELRASQLPAAWLNHVDAREQNTFDVLVDGEHGKYIRHYIIDWGDSLGLGFNPDRLSRRFGYSYALDLEQTAEDLFTLGLLKRPWHNPARTKVQIFGYYGVEGFVPSEWRGVYSLPAYAKRTAADTLWMVRIFSQITDEQIRAVVDRAQLPDPRQAEYLTQTLIGRRDRFFQEYLEKYVPLAHFELVRRTPGQAEQSLCFEDLAIVHGVSRADETYYQFRFRAGEQLERELGWLQFTPDPKHPNWSCARFPIGDHRPQELAGASAPDDAALRYGVLDIWVHQKPTVRPMGQVRLHFYDLGPERGYRLVGIERPSEVKVPADY